MDWRRKLLTFHLFDAFFAAASLLFHVHLNVFLATAFAHPSPSEHQAASPDKPSPTPLTNSIQILQPALVTPVRRPRGGSREALTARRCPWIMDLCAWTLVLGVWLLSGLLSKIGRWLADADQLT